MNATPHTQYEILPHADVLYTDAENDNGLNTVESIAKFIRSMVEERSSIYMPGIKEGFQSISISRAQLGLLEKNASPQLSKKLSHYLTDDDLSEVEPLLELAFWNPLVAAADKILEITGDDEKSQVAKQYATVKLYAAMNAGIGNMRMMMRSGAGAGADPERTRETNPPLRSEFETYTHMPAEQVLHVMKRGIMPQIAYAAHVEMDIDAEKLNKLQKAVFGVWKNDPQSLSAVHLIRPIDPVEWMKYGSLPTEEMHEEMRQAQKDFADIRLLPPPE